MARFRKQSYSRRTYAEMVRIKERLAADLEEALIRETALKRAIVGIARLSKSGDMAAMFSSPIEVWQWESLRDKILQAWIEKRPFELTEIDRGRQVI